MKILIIRPAALGDTLMLLPGLDRIRHSYSVILAGRRPGIHYMARFAGRCLDFEGMGWHTIFTDEPRVQNLPRVDIAAAFLRDADGKVRRNLQSLFPDGRIHVFPGLPQKPERTHAALHLAKCLREAGCTEIDPEECIGKALRVPLLVGEVVQGPKPASPRPGTPGSGPGQALGGVLETRMGGRIIFHPGSGGPEKNHSPEFWMDLIETMINHAPCRGLCPTILLGPAEAGLMPLFEGRLYKAKHDVVSSPGHEALLSLLRGATLFLGQDSGVTHLSAMLGVPTIALFRNSSVEMWRPLGPRVTVIQEKQDRVDVSLVLEEAESWLAKRPRDDGRPLRSDEGR